MILHRFSGSRVVRVKRPSLKNAFPPSPKFNVDALGKRKAHLKRLEGSTLNLGEGGDAMFRDGHFFERPGPHFMMILHSVAMR